MMLSSRNDYTQRAFVGVALPLLLFASAVGAQSPSPPSSSSGYSTLTFTIIGANTGNSSDLVSIPKNFTIWGEVSVTLVDTIYSVVASLLNDVSPPGTTPTPDRRAAAGNTTAAGGGSEPMQWYWIILIVVGVCIGVTAIVLAIYFGIEASKQKNDQAKATLLPQQPQPSAPPPPPPPGASPEGCITGFSPRGGRYTKIIQVPIACPRAPSCATV